MTERITNKDIDGIVYLIQKLAQELKIMPEDAYLIYSPGSSTKGYSPEVGVYYIRENGRSALRVHFLPEFTYKTTRKDVWNLLKATHTALEAVTRR